MYISSPHFYKQLSWNYHVIQYNLSTLYSQFIIVNSPVHGKLGKSGCEWRWVNEWTATSRGEISLCSTHGAYNTEPAISILHRLRLHHAVLLRTPPCSRLHESVYREDSPRITWSVRCSLLIAHLNMQRWDLINTKYCKCGCVTAH